MRILVTGGSGFIGKHITERLVEEGHEVLITSTGTEADVKGVSKILYHSLDGIDWGQLKNLDCVFHQMANNDTRCMDQAEMDRTNVASGIKLFSVAYHGGCKNFVYASSTAVYGNEPAPYTEQTPISPLNSYAKSKAAFDEYAMEFAKNKKVNVSGLRYCNVYGPGEYRKGRRASMIGQIIRKVLFGPDNKPTLFEFGEQRRDWIYVKDVVEANLKAMNRPAEEPYGRIYNIGSGTSVTFNDIIATLNDIRGNGKIKPKYIPCPFPDEYQNHTECDIEKARFELGFEPGYTLRSGIEEYYLSEINLTSFFV